MRTAQAVEVTRSRVHQEVSKASNALGDFFGDLHLSKIIGLVCIAISLYLLQNIIFGVVLLLVGIFMSMKR